MSVISVFRNYMEEHHPHLAWKDWKADVKNEELKVSISNEFQEELTCWVCFYDGGA